MSSNNNHKHRLTGREGLDGEEDVEVDHAVRVATQSSTDIHWVELS